MLASEFSFSTLLGALVLRSLPTSAFVQQGARANDHRCHDPCSEQHGSRQRRSWLIFDVRLLEPSAPHTMITIRKSRVKFGSLSTRAAPLGSLPAILGGTPMKVCSGQDATWLGFGPLSSRGRPSEESLASSIQSRSLELPEPCFPSVLQTCELLPCGASPSASGVFFPVQSPNKALEPTLPSVTPRAEPRVAPAVSVAHL
jgi:hypothetical protein